MTEPCAISGCGKNARARGWCPAHYRRWQLYGDPNVMKRNPDGVEVPCAVDGCERSQCSRGYCDMHYRRLKGSGNAGPANPTGIGKVSRPCKGSECNNTFECYHSSNKKYCSPACRYESPQIADLLSENIGKLHRLSSLDEIVRTAVCEVCGFTDVRFNAASRKAAARWRCRTAERARDWARKYGMTVKDVQAMRDVQGNACALCSARFGSLFYVDHCHRTGAVRGLLCSTCNTGIGLLKDDPELMRKAADYVSLRQ